MSQYENYNRTATNYDKTRYPVGLDIIREAFRQNSTPLKKQRILDAGCGTGNYSLAIIEDVGQIVCMDGNEAMLKEAAAKLIASPHDNYEIKRGTLPALPLDDESVDGIMINQVIHHLDVEKDYPVLRKLCEETSRVLKPGGRLIMNTCSARQIRDAYWYLDSFPTVVEKLVKRYPPVDLLISMLSECGYMKSVQTIPSTDLFMGDSYFDLDGPLKPEWRDGDSAWALLSVAELEQGLARYTNARDAGALPGLLERCEKRRKEIGQSVFVSAEKMSKAGV